MRIARLGQPEQEIPVGIDGDRVLDLRDVTTDVTPEFLEHHLPVLDLSTLPELRDTAGLRHGAPTAQPTAVVCVGVNYAKHAAESGARRRRVYGRPSSRPRLPNARHQVKPESTAPLTPPLKSTR
ncbi:hypothetical protein ACWEWX_30280 [Streptomyces asiaticus]